MPLQYEILVDSKENEAKCTILPLAYRPDFRIRRFYRGQPVEPLTADLLLHPDGEPLEQMMRAADQPQSFAVIDCNWKRLALVLQLIVRPLPRLARIPDGFRTAYPRRNFHGLDPENGLATIEAVFIAAAFLGTWDESLLKEYHFAPQFLALNEALFCSFGLWPPSKTDAPAVPFSGSTL